MTQIRRILVPTDFSASAGKAVDQAAELARALRAEIVLLHVVGLPVHYAPHALVPVPAEWTQAIREDARARLGQECARLTGVTATSEIREGHPDDGILKAATEVKADLIVMGTHGWSGLKRALLGSTAERVVRHSSIPVLTIRTRE